MPMRDISIVGQAAMALLLLSACAPDEIPDYAPWQPKTSTIHPTTVAHDLHFARGAIEIGESQKRSLAAFLSADPGRSPQVTLISTHAATDRLTARREAAVSDTLSRMGIDRSAISVKADPTAPRDGLRVSVKRYVIAMPNCPDWSHPEGNGSDNRPTSNFGCATETNLAGMVANPADLVAGSTRTAGDGELAALRVRQYRAGALTKSLQTTASSSSGGSAGADGAPPSGSGAGN